MIYGGPHSSTYSNSIRRSNSIQSDDPLQFNSTSRFNSTIQIHSRTQFNYNLSDMQCSAAPWRQACRRVSLSTGEFNCVVELNSVVELN